MTWSLASSLAIIAAVYLPVRQYIRAIRALLGHRTAAMALHYSRQADRKRAAAAAIVALEPGTNHEHICKTCRSQACGFAKTTAKLSMEEYRVR